MLGADPLDLMRLEEAGPELVCRVVSTGRLLYAESAKLANEVELGVLRHYQDLAPFRSVERDYLRLRHGVDGR